ncbi:MAG: hypothetical protein ACK4MF_01125, partial [Hyphomicrobiaceae bacterium]
DGADDEQADDPATSAAPSGPLRIASWHLDDAKAAGALALLPDPDRAWRHTFGAERQTAPAVTFDAASLDADVVLLQGVRRISDARALFPAREWRLIVSRQMLSPVLTPRAANRVMLDEVVPERPATTAVAVRFRRGLRVGGQVHLTDVVEPVEVPNGTAAARETAAALAVSVLVDRKPIWVVSVDLVAACARAKTAVEAGAAQPCPAFEALRRWRPDASRSLPVIIGGTTTRGGAACSHQSLAVIERSLLFPAENTVDIGCLARMRWP